MSAPVRYSAVRRAGGPCGEDRSSNLHCGCGRGLASWTEGGNLVGKLPKALLLGGCFVASLGARADEASPQEFPLFDQTLASHAQLRMVARKATQALADAPESPETLSALLLAKRWDNAAGVLHAIVAQHPGDLPRALDAVSEGWSAAPDTRRFGEALAVE